MCEFEQNNFDSDELSDFKKIMDKVNKPATNLNEIIDTSKLDKSLTDNINTKFKLGEINTADLVKRVAAIGEELTAGMRPVRPETPQGDKAKVEEDTKEGKETIERSTPTTNTAAATKKKKNKVQEYKTPAISAVRPPNLIKEKENLDRSVKNAADSLSKSKIDSSCFSVENTTDMAAFEEKIDSHMDVANLLKHLNKGGINNSLDFEKLLRDWKPTTGFSNSEAMPMSTASSSERNYSDTEYAVSSSPDLNGNNRKRKPANILAGVTTATDCQNQVKQPSQALILDAEKNAVSQLKKTISEVSPSAVTAATKIFAEAFSGNQNGNSDQKAATQLPKLNRAKQPEISKFPVIKNEPPLEVGSLPVSKSVAPSEFERNLNVPTFAPQQPPPTFEQPASVQNAQPVQNNQNMPQQPSTQAPPPPHQQPPTQAPEPIPEPLPNHQAWPNNHNGQLASSQAKRKELRQKLEARKKNEKENEANELNSKLPSGSINNDNGQAAAASNSNGTTPKINRKGGAQHLNVESLAPQSLEEVLKFLGEDEATESQKKKKKKKTAKKKAGSASNLAVRSTGNTSAAATPLALNQSSSNQTKEKGNAKESPSKNTNLPNLVIPKQKLPADTSTSASSAAITTSSNYTSAENTPNLNLARQSASANLLGAKVPTFAASSKKDRSMKTMNEKKNGKSDDDRSEVVPLPGSQSTKITRKERNALKSAEKKAVAMAERVREKENAKKEAIELKFKVQKSVLAQNNNKNQASSQNSKSQSQVQNTNNTKSSKIVSPKIEFPSRLSKKENSKNNKNYDKYESIFNPKSDSEVSDTEVDNFKKFCQHSTKSLQNSAKRIVISWNI